MLTSLAESGVSTVSSEVLANAAGVGPAKLRKDLSHLGSYGTRGVGYDVEFLVYQISRALGLTQHYSIVIVGVGNLGQALAGYAGFGTRGFRIAGLVDADRARVGELIAGVEVRHVDELEAILADNEVSIGVIATPASAAQDVCDRLVGAGVTSVLNFAPGGAVGARRGRRPQGGSVDRAADPRVPRTAQVVVGRRPYERVPERSGGGSLDEISASHWCALRVHQ